MKLKKTAHLESDTKSSFLKDLNYSANVMAELYKEEWGLPKFISYPYWLAVMFVLFIVVEGIKGDKNGKPITYK